MENKKRELCLNWRRKDWTGIYLNFFIYKFVIASNPISVNYDSKSSFILFLLFNNYFLLKCIYPYWNAYLMFQCRIQIPYRQTILFFFKRINLCRTIIIGGNSYITIIRQFQNKVIRTMDNAFWYVHYSRKWLKNIVTAVLIECLCIQMC